MHTVNKIIKDSINTIGIHWSHVCKMYIISMHIIWDIGDIYIYYIICMEIRFILYIYIYIIIWCIYIYICIYIYAYIYIYTYGYMI